MLQGREPVNKLPGEPPSSCKLPSSTISYTVALYRDSRVQVVISGFLSAAVAIPWKTTLCTAREQSPLVILCSSWALFQAGDQVQLLASQSLEALLAQLLQRAPWVQHLLPSAWTCTDPFQASGCILLPGLECMDWSRAEEVFPPLPSPDFLILFSSSLMDCAVQS